MQKTNIMQSERIPVLLFKMSFPMMLSMLIQALYNVVDSIFVAMVSESALTAVSLAFPLQNLLIAAAVGTGVGINSLLSRRLGEGRHEEANHVASTSIFLAITIWVLFVIIGLFLAKPFLSLFTKDEKLLRLSTSYSRICLILSFGCLLSITIEKLVQATGNSVQPMAMQLLGAITNIILDPVFIFVFKLGVNGAAIATVIGQIASMLLAFFFLRKNDYIQIKIKDIKPNKIIIKDIFQVGLPSIIMNSIGTIMVSLINKILIIFSSTAVSVFGVYFKLQSFVFMPVFGLNNGVIPILGFNYGAKNKKRMISTMKLGLVVALLIMFLGTLIFQFFPKELLSLFSATQEMYQIGIPALKSISLCFIPAAISIILISSFQATGFGFASMMVSIIRQLIVLCPCAFILSKLIGINGVWYSFAIAEIFGLTCSIIFFIHVYNKKIKNL